VLSLVNGAFSERFAHIAETCGRTVDRYVVDWGSVHDLDEVATRLAGAEYAAVTVVHSETSTGARNDVRGITGRAHQHGAVCLIDSVSGVGGAELRFDEWGLDYVLTGSQKALALPPGLAFGVASERFMERLRSGATTESGRGVYFDLMEFETYVLKHQAPNTPAISLYYALDTQLQAIIAEGMEARWARHLAMSRATSEWVDATRDQLGLDVRILADSSHRSPTVTTVMLPDGMTGGQIASATEEQGITIGTGYGKLKQSSIRIGHMGDHTLATLRACLDACTVALTAA
jgi:aspartate aminotransferase-like enzyme